MNNWDEYYNVDVNSVEETPIPQKAEDTTESYAKTQNEPTENESVVLSEEMLNEFLQRLSGKNKDGISKSILSYQTYNFDSVESDPDRSKIYQVNSATVRISRNKSFQDIYTVDISFPDSSNQEIKLLWSLMQKHLKNQLEFPNNRWILYFNLLERDSISSDTEIVDTVVTANIINPIMYYLTREIPDMKVKDELVNGEMQGGNIIRMLVPNELLTFTVSEEINTQEIKAEALRNAELQMYSEEEGE